jgi:SAM-dependent methyltransferase
MIRKKRVKDEEPVDENGEDTLARLSANLREKSANGHRIEFFDDSNLMENVHLTNAYYDKCLTGDPSSQRKAAGPFVSFFKRIIRRLVGWYVEPALHNQRLFNAYTTRSVNEMKRYLDHLQIDEDILSTIMRRDLAMFRANIVFLNRYLEGRLQELEGKVAPGPAVIRDAVPAEAPSHEHDGFLDSLDVLALEQRIYGTPRMVKERQKFYLQYFRDCENVFAVGCGRGELLELLEQEGVEASGVETNLTLAGYCRDKGLSVERADSYEFLEGLDDFSCDGIILSRFAGHQSPDRLVRMLEVCRRKLTDGGVLVIETPNPFSLYAVASYALEDSDRVHPLHPETLKLLCLSAGFVEPTLAFLNPLPPEEQLEELDLSGSESILDPRENELFAKINHNISRLNRILFSHRDYSVITRKASPGDGS